jgi:hypothetical protein
MRSNACVWLVAWWGYGEFGDVEICIKNCWQGWMGVCEHVCSVDDIARIPMYDTLHVNDHLLDVRWVLERQGPIYAST